MACHDIQERSKLEKGVHLKQHTLESLNLHELGSHKSQLSIDGLFETPTNPKLWQTVMHWSRSDPEIRWRTIAVKDNRSEGQEWWPVQTFTIRVQRLIKSSLFSNTSTKCKVDTMDCRMKWSPCFRGVTILQVSSLKSRLCSKMLLWSCVARLSLESNIFWYHETSG